MRPKRQQNGTNVPKPRSDVHSHSLRASDAIDLLLLIQLLPCHLIYLCQTKMSIPKRSVGKNGPLVPMIGFGMHSVVFTESDS
jgi:hypothetical protein